MIHNTRTTIMSPKRKTMSLELSAIDQLSDDLLARIFHSLPLSVLLQCKSVNQRFFRLISNPSFVHKPLEAHKVFILFQFCSSLNDDHKMLFSIDSNNKTNVLKGSNFLPRSWPQDRNQVRVKATQYDLLLCATQSHCYTHYSVCNPFTKQCVTLPPLHSHAQELSRVGFICDQSRSRFRVVHVPILCFKYVNSFQVNMFSSETCEWSVSNVSVPRDILMSNLCSKNILVYNDKFVWWIERNGFLVCDPFNDLNNKWDLIHMDLPPFCFRENKKSDVYAGICNGRIRILTFSYTDWLCEICDIVSFEEGKLSKSHLYHRGFNKMKNVKLLGHDPHCDSVLYLYSKQGIFQCDYKKKKVECMYTAAGDEDIAAWGNLMSLVLPESPTPVPTFIADKFLE